MRKKKALTLLLVAAMACSMTGCKKDGNGGNGGNGGSGAAGAAANATSETNQQMNADNLDASKQNVYQEELLNLNSLGDDHNIMSTYVDGDNMYVVLQVYDYKGEYDANDYHLLTIDSKSMKMDDIKLTIPAMEQSSASYGDGQEDSAEGNAADGSTGSDEGISLLDETSGANAAADDIMPIGESYPDEEYDTPTGVEVYSNLYNISFTNDNKIIGLLNVSTYNYDTYEGTNDYSLVVWNMSGEMEAQIPFSSSKGSISWVNSLNGMSDGTISLVANIDYEKYVCLNLDMQGNVLAEVDVVDEGDSMGQAERFFAGADGKLIFTAYQWVEGNEEASGYCLNTLDPKTGVLGTSCPLPDELRNGINSISVTKEGDLVASNSAGVYSFKLGDKNATYLMNYVNSDVDCYSFEQVNLFADGRIFAVYNTRSEYKPVASVFTYVNPEDIPDKTVFTVAGFSLNSDVLTRIIAYNKASKTSRIVIKEYVDPSTWDYEQAQTDLNNDILAGRVPDVLVDNYGSIDTSVYAKKGLFADIEEMIKNDPDLANEKFLDNVMEGFKVNGKLYSVVPAFEVRTIIGKTKNVGTGSWTMQDFVNLAKQHPDSDTFRYMTRADFITKLMNYSASDYLDVNTGKCNFNNDSFIAALEYAAKLPEEIDWSSYGYDSYEDKNTANEGVLLEDAYIYNLKSYYYYTESYFMDPVSIVGFPCENGDGSIMFASQSFSIAANSQNKEAAWDFVKYYLTPEYQDSMDYDIPVLESSFEKWGNDATERSYWENEDGSREYYDETIYVNGEEIVVEPCSKEHVQELKDFVKSVKRVSYSNDAIIGIIEEEASAFFSGQKSAKDVANVIQSRVQLYVNENQ